VCRPFADGKAGGGASFDRLRFLVAEQGHAIVLVALRIAAGDTEAGAGKGGSARSQTMHELYQVVGILSGGIDADDKVDGAVAGGNLRESLLEPGVAGRRLGERQFGGGRLQVVAEEGGVVPIAGRVDADADAPWLAAERRSRWRVRGNHKDLRKEGERGTSSRVGPPRTLDREEACDERSPPQDGTSSGVQHGGVNLQQEVAPQQTERPPRDLPSGKIRPTRCRGEMNIQADNRPPVWFRMAPGFACGRLLLNCAFGQRDARAYTRLQTDPQRRHGSQGMLRGLRLNGRSSRPRHSRSHRHRRHWR
jgi:hypothetical protein